MFVFSALRRSLLAAQVWGLLTAGLSSLPARPFGARFFPLDLKHRRAGSVTKF
jgi:hypothetical protein